MTSAIDKIFGGNDSPPPAPASAAPAPAPAAAPAAEKETPAGSKNADIEARAEDFATREGSLNQRAASAGAVRSGNDADVLGYVMPRKRSAGRAILG